MADKTISSLNNKQPGSSAVFPYSEGGVTYNATLNQIIPTGVIMMWSGSIASVPSGWALCNGANGTPNLQDRFIVGAGSSYGVSNTGGNADATLPYHTHSISDPGHGHDMLTVLANGTWNGRNDDLAPGRGGSNRNGNTSSNATGISINAAGSSATNANLPPYYALAYIMKL